MASKILPGILKKLLGKYIEGLDTLSLPFWKGEIVLENLKIKKDIFESNDLPFELQSGVIKRVVISIPWLRFLKDPIVVNVDGIFLLFGRRDIHRFSGSDATLGDKNNNNGNTKNSNTISSEDLKTIQSTLQEESREFSGLGADGFQFRFLKKILKCLRLQVNNIHICYQDFKTSPGESFSVGITLEAFSFTSTDNQWIPTKQNYEEKGSNGTLPEQFQYSMHESASSAFKNQNDNSGAKGEFEDIHNSQVVDQVTSYKLASIFNFSIYWDSMFGQTKRVTPEDMDVLLMHSIPRQKVKVKHKYLVQPVSGFLKIILVEKEIETVTNDGVFSSAMTQFNISIGLKQIDVHLMDIQYRDMLNLLSFIQDWRRVLKYKEFRPLVPIHGNATKWWHFAFKAILSDIKKKKAGETTWKEVEENRKLRECYIKLYTERELKGDLSRLETKLIEEIEKSVTYEDIILFRTISEKEFQLKRKEEIENISESGGWWLGGWFGFQNKNVSETNDKITLNSEELKFLEVFLKLDLKKLAGKPQNTILFNFSSNIKKLSINILDWRDEQSVVALSTIEIEELNLFFEQAYNTRLKFSAGSFNIIDKCSPNTKFENIIVEKHSFNGHLGSSIDLELEKKIFDLYIILNPPQEPTDYFITMKLDPVYFINSKLFVDTMIPFFTHGNQEALDSLKYSVIKRIKILQEFLISELKHLIRNQKVADINIDVSIPSVVFPESYDKEDTLLLVCNLGNFQVKTQPHNSEWESLDFSEINDQSNEGIEDVRYARYVSILKDRVKWWRDNCTLPQVDTPIETQSYLKNYVQQHRKTINQGMDEDSRYPEHMDINIDNQKTTQDTTVDDDSDWNEISINVNNAQFYDGILFTITDINVKICNFSQISNYNYLVSPFNLNTFIELCSRPYDLKLPQIKCKSELSKIQVNISDKDLYEIAKIIGKNGILGYFMDMERKSGKELADKYETVQIKTKKSKGFEIHFSLFSDSRSILNSRQKTKERLTKTTLLRFFFIAQSINMQLHYLESSTVSFQLDKLRCRSLAKFMHMNVQVDLAFIEMRDSNSITPVLSIFPHRTFDKCPQSHHRSNSNNSPRNYSNEANSKYPLSIVATSISKNSLEYDYIDFILVIQTQFVKINIPKECAMALIAIMGTIVSDANRYYQKKKSLLTVEGSLYKNRIGVHTHPKRRKMSEKLEVNEFDPNDLKTKIQFKVPSFAFTLSTIESDLISFQFEDISINGLFQLPLVDVDLVVRDMRFIDYTNMDGVYPHILISQKSQNLLNSPLVNMHIVTHSLEKAHEWGFNQLINLNIGKIQTTLLFQTINLIRNFIHDISSAIKKYFPFLFQVMAIVDGNEKKKEKSDNDNNNDNQNNNSFDNQDQIILSAADEIKDDQDRIIEIVKKKKTFTNLEIVIDNNVLIIPKNSRSKSSLRCSVGKVILTLDQMNPRTESINVKVYGVNLSSQYEDVLDPIISDPIKLDLSFLHSQETSLKDKSIETILSITKIHLTLSQYQYNLLYNIYQQNLNQTIIPPPPSEGNTVERLNEILSIKLDIKEFVELNFEDEKTNDSRFFSMLISKPYIYCSIFNNGDTFIGIKVTGISVRDKNRLIVPPEGYQEIINIGLSAEEDPTLHRMINQPFVEAPFEILSFNMESGFINIKIDIKQLNVFCDLFWMAKLITFLSPILDPDSILNINQISKQNQPLAPPPPPPLSSSHEILNSSKRTYEKEWKLYMIIELSAKSANIMIGEISTENPLVLLMSSQLGISMQFGADGMIKILLDYDCQKGLLGIKAKDESNLNISRSILAASIKEILPPKHSTHFLWFDLNKSAKLFLESFKTNIHLCFVPEGNQFIFCELNNLSLVFSGKSYKYLLDIYDNLQKIIYDSSKSKDITDESIKLRESQTINSKVDLPIPINIKRKNSIAIHNNNDNSNNNIKPINPQIERHTNQFYKIKTKSVEMIRAHQARVSEKKGSFYDPEIEGSTSGSSSSSSSVSSDPLSRAIVKKPDLSIVPHSSNQNNSNTVFTANLTFTQISISLKNLVIIVMDDLSKHKMNTPIFNIKIAYGFCKSMIKSNKIDVEFDSVFSMDYFNNRIAYWEPFIEPWLFKAMMGLGKELSFDLVSTDLLNINFTIPLMDNLSLFLQTYSKEFGYPFNLIVANGGDEKKKKRESTRFSLIGTIKKLKHKKQKSYAPFFIQNQTGSRLRYRLETHSGQPVEGISKDDSNSEARVVIIENYGTFFELNSGESSPIKFLPDVQINLDTFSQLVLAVELLGVEKSISIPMDKIKIYEYPVFLDSTSSTKLFCNVSIQKGTKYISIYFPLVLHNKTSFPIDIATVTSGFGDAQTPNYSTVIKVGQKRAPLAINRMKNVLLKMKPSSDEFKWSTETLNINEISENKDEKFSCISKSGEKIIYIKCFFYEQDGCIIISLSSMLKIKNLLPYPISYKLKTPVENIPILRKEFESTAEQESKIEVYDLPIIDKFKFMLKIEKNQDNKGEWSEVKSISEKEDNQSIQIISINDSKNLNLNVLHLNMEFISLQGERVLLLYNQYWIFNKSGLNLSTKKSYRSKDYMASVFYLNHDETVDTSNKDVVVPAEDWYEWHQKREYPLLFSFKKNKDVDNSIRLRVGNSKWSHKISITAIGDRGTLAIQSHHVGAKNMLRTYHIGISVDLAPNLKTKVVVFTPRFIFHNLHPYPIFVRQNGDHTDSTLIRIKPLDSVPFYYFVENGHLNLKYKIDHPGFDWSPPFSIQTFSDFCFSIVDGEKSPSIPCAPYLRIKTNLEVATILVLISELSEPPYKILNNTDYQISVGQKKTDESIDIKDNSSLTYVWKHPMDEHILEVNIFGQHRASFKVDKIKTFKPIEFYHEGKSVAIKVTVEAEESTRVLILSDKTTLVLDKYEETLRQSFRLHLTGVGISLINSNPTELLYVSVDEILCEYFISSFLQKLEMKIMNTQVDNQLSKVTPFSHPVLMFSEPSIPNTPFLHMRIVRSMKMKSIDYYHHVSVKIQEINVKLEEKFLYVLLEFANSLDFSFWTGNKKTKTTLHNMDMLTPIYSFDIGDGFIDDMVDRSLPSLYGKKMYFETLSIDPLSIYLTFDLSNKSGSIRSLEQAPMVRSFRRIGFVLVSFQQAHIFLNKFHLNHAFGSNEELLAPIFRHYINEGLSEVYKILGAFNLFGNPVGLVTNFGIGFKEFFVNIGRGLMGNRASFGTGGKSLAKHSVYGLFDSGAKFTASAGKAISTMSMDQRYILERQYIIGESPNNFMQGLILGARAAKTGVYRGLTGFVRLPYEGGKSQGVKGAFKGIGKGTAGLVLKPVSGGFDFASKISEGIKNSTQLNIERKRVRFPRPLFSDSPLETYDASESYGHFLFLTYIITAGKLKRIAADQINQPLMEVVSKDERYISHLIYRNKKTLLFTNKRIVCLYDTDGFRTKFDVKYAKIIGINENEKNGGRIVIKVNKSKKLGMFSKKKNKQVEATLKCTGAEKTYIYEKILEYCKIFNPTVADCEDFEIKDPIPIPPPPPPPLVQTIQPYPLQYNDPIHYFNPNNSVNNQNNKIQPIIFQNDLGPMRNDLNPILANLLAQQPNQNMEIPIWISQGFNPPKPPETLIPQRFRDPNLYNPPINTPYTTLSHSTSMPTISQQPPQMVPPPPPPPLPSHVPNTIVEEPSFKVPKTGPTTTTSTVTPSLDIGHLKAQTPSLSTSGILKTSISNPDLSKKYRPSSVRFSETDLKEIQNQIKTPSTSNSRIVTLPAPSNPIPSPVLPPNSLPPPPPPLYAPPIVPSSPNKVSPLVIQRLQYKKSTPTEITFSPKTPGINYSDKVDLALNTILEIQKLQSQQMSQLQKNQQDLQKLLIQQQSSEFQNIMNQQQQIQSIIAQYKTIAKSPSSTLINSKPSIIEKPNLEQGTPGSANM
ncbi:hypothetical protein CYY_004528 [Polysphondylium violaceum]|uniref:Vacuolar protein sorting-associated protein 13 family protein n=1 Tax=Polysphondylium violaceum TaxID=133409 RepID=A0A8J4PWG2_9MYCE|nr:hypothetical protein CYY_004528 [Polysphondylium violaceum]